MNKHYIKTLDFHKIANLILFLSSLFILSYSSFNITSTILNKFDYLFLAILLASFILINKFHIKLNNSYLDFNDYILVICYFIFNIYILVFFVLLGYLLTFLIDNKYNRKCGIRKGIKQIFNTSLIITSLFLSHVTLNLFVENFILTDYEIISIILFSIFFYLYNYLIFCLDLSLETKKVTFITLENGLYYILLSFAFCLILALISLRVFKLFYYTPIIIIILFLNFSAFTINNIEEYKRKNTILMYLSECTTEIISKGEFKEKLFTVVKTIEKIIPFTYCGIYLFRKNYNYIHPISYKSKFIINPKSLNISVNNNYEIYNTIESGKPFYTTNEAKFHVLAAFNENKSLIKSMLIIPIKSSKKLYGCIIISLNKYLNSNEDFSLISILGKQLGIAYENICFMIKSSLISLNKYSDLLTYMDNNIKYKILFTTAIIEIINYKNIISQYNFDLYESLKKDLSEQIKRFLSPYDIILYTEKEDIYIEFIMCDSINAENKLKEVSIFLDTYKYKNISIKTNIIYSTVEYPQDGTTKEDLLETAHRKLFNKKKSTY